MNDYFHKASKFTVDFAVENNISEIIIGKNKDWKQDVKFHKNDKQTFIQIPFNKLIEQIKYKAEDVGIVVKVVEESYTSKVDHLAYETMEHHQKYLGRGVKRGLFKSSIGKFLNADINGSIGIMIKVAGNSFVKDLVSRGNVFLPYKLCF